MTREKLIKAYENMMYKAEEYDVWEEISYQLDDLTTAEIEKMYKQDKAWYGSRSRIEQH